MTVKITSDKAAAVPEALRLAAIPIFERSITWQSQATIELRRLHAQRDQLLKALNAMLTHMGMDEDEWNKPTFDQARAAIKKAEENT